MTVNSLYFLLFLTCLLFAYYVFWQKYRFAALLAGSVAFYVLACATSPVYLFLTSLSIWAAGLWMDRQERLCAQLCEKDREHAAQWKRACKKKKKGAATVATLLNLAILLTLKYGGFFGEMANAVLGWAGISIAIPQFLAPLGISYYTLIAIGYVIDLYKGKFPAQKNYAKLLLFLAYFPQMTQGPFNRYQPMAAQLYEGHRFSYHNFSYGCQRMLWGFFKKMVVADNLQPVSQAIFDGFRELPGPTCFVGCVALTVSMYADFSGYMDIVAGASQLFGISIAENFARPFFSKSLAEYWRRWHISLGSWFRDYVFYPLAVSKPAVKFGKKGRKWFGPRVGKLFPSLFALTFVWVGTGLWHDASWRYIFWGFANGAVIMGAMVLEPYFAKAKEKLSIRSDAKAWQFFCMARTFLLVCLLKIFPGPASTAASVAFAKRLFTAFSMPKGLGEWLPGIGTGDVIWLFFAIFLIFLVDALEEKQDMRDMLAKKPVWVRWGAYLFLLVYLLAVGKWNTSGTGGFAYAQF